MINKFDTRIGEGYLRERGGVVMIQGALGNCVIKSSNEICLIHRYGVFIYRIQHGIKCIQVDDKD